LLRESDNSSAAQSHLPCRDQQIVEMFLLQPTPTLASHPHRLRAAHVSA
jgi:hypothetical protein